MKISMLDIKTTRIHIMFNEVSEKHFMERFAKVGIALLFDLKNRSLL